MRYTFIGEMSTIPVHATQLGSKPCMILLLRSWILCGLGNRLEQGGTDDHAEQGDDGGQAKVGQRGLGSRSDRTRGGRSTFIEKHDNNIRRRS